MDSASDQPPVPFFSWDRLPISIQETILSLLPISALIVCKAVSRSWRSTIQSPAFTASYPRHHPRRRDQDLLFLLFADARRPGRIAAYHPSRDRWLSLPLPPDLSRAHAAGGSLVMAELEKRRLVVANLFAGARTAVLPPMEPVFRPYALALIEETPPDYKIVAVSTADRVYSQVYDSRSGRWELRGQLAGRFAVLGNAALLDGLLFCLSRGPDHLLTFDPVGGEWSIVDVTMPLPSIVCSHIFVFRGGLFLVAGDEEVGVIARVGIWELDRSEREWRSICCVPNEYFGEFGGGGLKYFETVDRGGNICFYNRAAGLVLMHDLSERRWWWPQPCYVPKNKRLWFGHALEPHIGLLN